jgi:hypothetical protein
MLVRSSECQFDETIFPFKEPHLRAAPIQDDDPVELQWGQGPHDGPLLLNDGHNGRVDRDPDASASPPNGATPARSPSSSSSDPAQAATPPAPPPATPPLELSREARRLVEQNAGFSDQHYAHACGGIDAVAFDAMSSRALAAEDTNVDATTILGYALAVVSAFYGFEPPTAANFGEATKCAKCVKWRAAMDSEMAAMDRLNVFEYVPASTVPVG